MAMFHLSIKVCSSRSGGKSSVAAAAYRACESIEDERTGITHDFTRKGGHVYGEVMLCTNAPAEYKNRAVLWNAVEKIEKNKNAQTSREVEVSLPIELNLKDPDQLEMAKNLLRDFIRDNFVSRGMCADWNIHNPDEDNHNPHCHIMLTMRPIKENGEWGDKEKKAYTLDNFGNRVPILDAAKVKKFEKNNGETYEDALRRAATPEERDEIILSVQKLGAKNRRMWKRETVDSTGWNEQSLAEQWRCDWADKENALLERINSASRVDHRSYKRQGVDKIPTIHEGVAGHLSAMNKKPVTSDKTIDYMTPERITVNKVIKDINSEMAAMEKIMSFCKDKIRNIKAMIINMKNKIVEGLKDTKDFLESLVRGDGNDRTGKANGTAGDRRSPEGEESSDRGTGSSISEASIAESRTSIAESRAAIIKSRAAVSESRTESEDTGAFLGELRAKERTAIEERENREDEQERPGAEEGRGRKEKAGRKREADRRAGEMSL
jgi:hypothetical protein